MAVALIAFGLGVVTIAYALVLNIRQVREWYTPDRTWVTVVIGDGLIIGALALTALVGAIGWDAWWIALLFTCVAGAPIIVWQLIRKLQRQRRAAQALERE